MTAVYHFVPRDMVGNVLYPLNQLANVDRSLYERQRAKYAGREEVLDFRLPGSGVRFNDTVHCSSLHPHHLYAARRMLGLPAPARGRPESPWTGLVFEIPLERIAPNPVFWYSGRTLWINGAPNEDVPLVPPDDEFEPFDADRYRPLEAPTPAHLEYLRRMQERGEPPLTFVHIPHVLVAGPIDVDGLRTFGWDEPPT